MTPYNVYHTSGYGFSLCCGSREIGSFAIETKKSPRNTRTPFKKATKEDDIATYNRVLRENNKGSLIATTIKAPLGTKANPEGTTLEWWQCVNKSLKAAGWKKVGEYVNPNTTRTILLWHYTRKG
jgi:hypothetical protein